MDRKLDKSWFVYMAWGITKEANMPLLVPILLGVPVLFVGGYYIIQSWH